MKLTTLTILGNRRVRSVGELVENQARIGVYRMERAIKEKMTTLDVESVHAPRFNKCKTTNRIALKDFFASISAFSVYGSNKSTI